MKLVVESAPSPTATESWRGVLSQNKIEVLLLEEGRDIEQAKATNDQGP